MYYLFYAAIAIAILFVFVYAGSGNKTKFNRKRFSTALTGMLLVQVILVFIVEILAREFFDPYLNFKTAGLAIFIFPLILALWATKHIK